MQSILCMLYLFNSNPFWNVVLEDSMAGFDFIDKSYTFIKTIDLINSRDLWTLGASKQICN
jgi:hypothetical protein